MTIPTGYGQISVITVGGGIENEAVWTIGFDNNAGDTPQEVAEAFDALLIASDYPDLLSSSVTYTGVHVKLGPDTTGPSYLHTVSTSGTVGGNAAPPNLAMLVHKATLLGGRQGRGRAYIGGLAEAALDAGGLLTSAQHTAAQTFVDNIAAGLILTNKPPVVLHADALTPTPMESMTVDLKLATQRRRLRR